jgi:hypothetical protein
MLEIDFPQSTVSSQSCFIGDLCAFVGFLGFFASVTIVDLGFFSFLSQIPGR